MVLEHAPGGEVFDYIVARDRLKEEEARQFFRQILSAVGYIHEKGYAHRDLKPENLLLDANNQIKLIDFGLVAHPGHINDFLHTCCGSPAYAAPELITGNPYLGTEADVWSLGVLLYALLCGFLPFDDDNTAYLYRLIQKGKYDVPQWLSKGSVEILGQMLQTNPRYRITVPDLLKHPWVCKSYGVPVSYTTRMSLDRIDADVIAIIAKRYGQSRELMTELISQWKFDHTTATYFLLAKQKRDGKTPQLKMLLPASPALRRHGVRPSSLIGSSDAYFSIESLPDIVIDHDLTPTTPGPLSAPVASKSIHRLKIEAGAPVQRSHSVDFDSAFGESELSSIPIGGGLRSPTPSAKSQTLPPLTRDARAVSIDTRLDRLAQSPRSGHRSSLLSKIKSVFKPGSGGAARPRKLKGLYDVSSTSTRPPMEVLGELERVIELKGIVYRTKGYLIRCKTVHPVTRRVELAFDLEVCVLPKMDLIGVKRKRVKGDTWAYKRVCEELLSLAQL